VRREKPSRVHKLTLQEPDRLVVQEPREQARWETNLMMAHRLDKCCLKSQR
jgi:hypothetical protein